MTEQQPETLNSNNVPTPTPSINNEVGNSKLAEFKKKLVTITTNMLVKLQGSRFYKNKKVFWLLTSVFGVLLLVIILGLLFGNKNKSSYTIKPGPTPSSQQQNIGTTNDGSELSKIEQKLNELKNQKNVFDPKQSRLRPPSINFDVKF